MNSIRSTDSSIMAQEQDRAGRLIADYSIVAATAVLVWHYLTTFDKEVTYFWSRRVTVPSILYLANRYLAFLTAALNGASWPGSETLEEHNRCAATIYVYIIALFGQYAIWTTFSCLRIYALRRRWTWVVLIAVLSLIPIAICCLVVLVANIRPEAGRRAACYTLAQPANLSDSVYNSLTILSRGSLMLADAILVVITWSVTYHNRHADSILGKASLSTVLFRDGSVYFASLTLFNFLLVILLAASPSNPIVSTCKNSVSSFISPLTTIAMDCFLVDLHEAAASSARNEHSQCSVGTIRFARGAAASSSESHGCANPGAA